MDNDNNIFRQQALDKAGSPDELNKYIRSASPKLWFLLAAIIVFLAGIIVWADVGYVETKTEAVAVVDSSEYSVYLEPGDAKRLTDSAFVRIDDREYPAADVKTESENTIDIRYILCGPADGISDGTYPAQVVFNRLHPLQYILN